MSEVLGVLSSPRSALSSRNSFQCFPFVNRDVISLVALDDVLRFVLRRVMHITFEASVRNHSLHDRSADSSGFGVPFDMVAAFECFGHYA
jgi:hypothetical protein